MADNISIKITADVADLQAKFAVAKANSSALSSELNKLAKEAVNAGGATPELNAQLQKLGAQSADAKARVSALSQEMRGGQSSFRGFQEVAGLARQAVGAFGIALSIGEVIHFGESIFEAAEQLQHQAEVLGLSVTAYQAFAKSAQFAGVDVEDVNRALMRFNAAQGTAQTGVGNQAKAFNDLGVSASLTAEAALPAVARALLSITDNARRARDEVALFGRSGEELNPALEQWAKGAAVLAQHLGATSNMLDPKLAKAAKEAKDQMGQAFDSMEVAWTPAVVKLSQALTGLAGIMADATKLKSSDSLFDLFSGNVHRRAAADAGQAPFQSESTPSGHAFHVGSEGGAPKPNFTDSADAKKAAEEARHAADEIAQAYEQGALRHIESEAQANTAILDQGRESLNDWRSQAVALEDARYQATKDGLQKRIAADAEDKVALAKDKAEEEQLEQEHNDKLAAIDQEYTTKQRAQSQAALQDFVKAQDDRLTALTNALDKEYNAGQISALTRRDAEVMLTGQIEQQVLARFDAENAGLVRGTTAYDEAMKQRMTMVDGFTKHVQDADKQLQDIDTKSFEKTNRQILSSEDQLVDDFLTKRQGLGKDLVSVAENFLKQELSADINYWTEKGLLALEYNTKQQTVSQQGVLEQLLLNGRLLADAQTGQVKQTAAVIAGASERTAAETASAGAGGAAQVAAGSVSIVNDAKIAAANTYAAVSGIPVVGPALAVPAAGAAFAAVMAYDSLASLDVGTNFVPHDMVAQIHQGEAIIPKRYNPAAGGDAGGGGGGGDVHVHLNVSAIDAPGVQAFLNQNSNAITNTLIRALGRSPSAKAVLQS